LAHYQNFRELIEAEYPGIRQNPIVKKCLAKEKEAIANGDYVFYRSEPGELRTYEYFIEYLYQLVKLSTLEFPLSSHSFFKDAPHKENINAYLDRVKPMFKRSPEEPNVLLSANIPLLGNIQLTSSNTWHYFNTINHKKILTQTYFLTIFLTPMVLTKNTLTR